MSRYTGPSWKQARRLGLSLTGTGKELARRNYVPGQHGPNNRSKLSEYGLQLAEKQKLRFSYGLGEKQFRNLFVQATKIKQGTVGFNFMLLLERRLDNVVYRLGLATTRRQARQFVNHGHILVDGKRVDIPSFRVEVGQVISVREKSLNVPAIREAVEATLGRPAFVSFDADKLEGSLTRLPERDEINPEINESLVVEYYNKQMEFIKSSKPFVYKVWSFFYFPETNKCKRSRKPKAFSGASFVCLRGFSKRETQIE